MQLQAIVVGLLASVAAMVLGWVPKGDFDKAHGLLLCTSSVLTASSASLILGKRTCLLLLRCTMCNFAPGKPDLGVLIFAVAVVSGRV